MRKSVLTLIFTLWTIGGAIAATVTPAYKLGNSYTSESSSSKCLEGYAGSTLNNPNCHKTYECKTDADCVKQNGKNYVCARGRQTPKSETGVCRYQECSGTSDKVCAERYSHLRSCVLNESGYYECRITCNWQKIKEAGKAYIGSVNIADRMKLEYDIWTNPSGVNWNIYSENGSVVGSRAKYLSSSTVVPDYFYTCKYGKIERCSTLDLSETNWDEGYAEDTATGGKLKSGLKFQPCIPCVLMGGGTWGVGANEYIPGLETATREGYDEYEKILGKYPYSVKVKTASIDTDDSQIWTSGWGCTYTYGIRSARCAHWYAWRDKNEPMATRLNYTMPFNEKIGTGSSGIASVAGLRGVVELGASDVCMFWGNSPRYINSTDRAKCNTSTCFRSTWMHNMVWVPKQNKTVTMYSARTKGRAISYNFIYANPGTLLCCTLNEGCSGSPANSGHLECMPINPLY